MSKHGPNKFRDYISIHETIMESYRRRGYVVRDDLRLRELGSGVLYLVGSIDCAERIQIDVEKHLAIWIDNDGVKMVRTTMYTYNVHLPIPGRGNIFRYCSPHADHNQQHHVHRYSVLDGSQDVSTSFIPDEADRPTLGQVIEEAYAWGQDNLDAARMLLRAAR